MAKKRRRTRPRSLTFVQKITLLVALTLIITGLVNWALAGLAFYQTMRAEALRANRQTAETLARRLEDLVISGINLLTLYARDARLTKGDAGAAQAAIQQFRSQGGMFDGFSFVAADGRLEAIDPFIPSLIGSDLSGREYIRQVLGARRAYVSDAFPARTGRLVVVISVPVPDGRGRNVGVLSGSINLLSNNSLSRSLSSLERGGDVILVDRRGHVLYHPDPAMLMRDLSDNEPVRQVLMGREGVIEGKDEWGQRVLAALSPVRNAGWGVIARVPAAQLLGPLQRFNRQTFLVSLVTLVGAIVMGLLIAGRLVRPLHDLVRALRVVSRGDFDVRIPFQTRDEWGVLAAAFNRMVAELGSFHRELEARATTDPLTGVYNRGYLEERMGLELQWARRTETPLSLLMIDIDDFKAYNDAFGHPAGDEVLVACATLFREMVREGDLVARYGGEEFAVVLPNAGQDEAAGVAERMRQAVEDYAFPHRRVTISAGVACFPEHADDAPALLVRADEALYRAKGAGKNRVVIA